MFKKLLYAVAFTAFLTACSKNNDVDPDDNKEYKFIRVLVSDENTKQISLVNPRDGKIQSFDARFPKSAVYTTQSG